MRVMILAIGLILALGIITIQATSVGVTRDDSQMKSGVLTYIYFETTSGPSGPVPSTNTASSQPSESGSYFVSNETYAYLWSPQFTSPVTINAGKWGVELWVENETEAISYLTLSLVVTDSSGDVLSIIGGDAVVVDFDGTLTQVSVLISGFSVSIPANGYIRLAILVDNSPVTVHWGVDHPTNFQVSYYVLSM
jgi:hypothetical protein